METKYTPEGDTPESIYLDSLNLPMTNSVTRLFWEETLRVFKEQELSTHQQTIAELEDKFNKFREIAAKSGMLYLSINWEEPLPFDQALLKKHTEDQIEIDELKKQNVELKVNYDLAISGFRIKEIHLKNVEKQNAELVDVLKDVETARRKNYEIPIWLLNRMQELISKHESTK
jgi:hypothetical protein